MIKNRTLILTFDIIWNTLIVFCFVASLIREFLVHGTGDGPGMLALFYLKYAFFATVINLTFQVVIIRKRMKVNVGIVTILIKCAILFVCFMIIPYLEKKQTQDYSSYNLYLAGFIFVYFIIQYVVFFWGKLKNEILK